MQEINLNGVEGLLQAIGKTPFGVSGVNNRPSDDSFATHLSGKMASYDAPAQRPANNQSDRKPAEKTVDEGNYSKPAEKVINESNDNESAEKVINESNDNGSAEKVVDENGVEQKVTHTKKTEGQSQTQQTPDKEVVKVSDMIKKLNLNEDQVAELAYQLGVTVSELKDMTIEIDTGALINTPVALQGKNQFNPEFQKKLGNSAVIKGVLQDGTEIDIASMLNLDKEGEKANLNSIADKIANALGLDEKQVKTMADELGIQKISIETKASEKSDANMVKELIAQKGMATTNDNTTNNEQSSSQSDNGKEKSASPFLEKKSSSFEVQKEALNKAIKIEGADGSVIDGSEPTIKESTQFKQAVTTDKVVTETVIQKADGREVKFTKVTQVKTPNSETSRKIMNQIVEKAQILSLPNKTEAKITLTPAQLGSIDIKIVVQDAQVRGHIVVENQSVKQVVEQNIDQLKDAIANQGIDLGEVTVDVNQNKAQFDGQNNNGYEGGNGRAETFSTNDASAEDEQRQVSIEREQFRRTVNDSVVYMTA